MNLSEIEERLADATPGPWTAGKNYAAVIAPAIPLVCKGECDCNPTCNEMYGGKLIGESIEWADAELIMHAPTDLAELIAEVKRLQAELAKFYKCNEGKCYAWAAGIYHSDKVYHKEGE